MCRNIRRLYNTEPSASDDEIHEAALQFVRKVSGYRSPSQANEAPFKTAIDEVSDAVRKLLDTLVTSAPPRDRAADAVKTRARAAQRRNTPAE